MSGFDRKYVNRPKNYIHFWSQRVCLRRYGAEKIYIWLLKRLKPTISGLNRKCVDAPKNNIHFWTQPVRLRRFKSKKIHLRAFEGLKPIISGLNRKCVGGPKNNFVCWTQKVYLRKYGWEKIYVWLLKRLKPTISGLTGNAWADSKSDITIESTVNESPCEKDLTRTLYIILEEIAFFRFTSGFSSTSGTPEVLSYRRCTAPINYRWPQKKFGTISGLWKKELKNNCFLLLNQNPSL